MSETTQSQELERLLSAHQIEFTHFEHPAVFNCEEARQHLSEVPGLGSKNLFLQDEKSREFYLVMVSEKTQVDLKRLAAILGLKRFSFGKAEDMKALLNLTPGSVSVFGLISDPQHKVTLIIDAELWQQPLVQCHPQRNTATLVISPKAIGQFLEISGHEPRIVEIPGKNP